MVGQRQRFGRKKFSTGEKAHYPNRGVGMGVLKLLRYTARCLSQLWPEPTYIGEGLVELRLEGTMAAQLEIHTPRGPYNASCNFRMKIGCCWLSPQKPGCTRYAHQRALDQRHSPTDLILQKYVSSWGWEDIAPGRFSDRPGFVRLPTTRLRPRSKNHESSFPFFINSSRFTCRIPFRFCRR